MGTSRKGRGRGAQLVKEAGGRYLEAPVSGSTGPAQQGALIFMTAGDEEAFRTAGPMLDVMGKAKYFLGAVRFPRSQQRPPRDCTSFMNPLCGYLGGWVP